MRKKKALDPYRILGVGRGAGDIEIKSAFRRRAKDTHPDHGGNREEFEAVSRANIVLSDPVKRAKFDATGDIDDDAIDVTDQAALNLIGQVISQAIAGESDPCKVDLMGSLKAHFAKAIGEIEKHAAGLKRNKARAEKMRGRFKRRKGEGDNILDRMMGWQIDHLSQATTATARTLEQHRRAIEIMSEYDFARDPPEQMMQVFVVNMNTSASTTGW